MSPETIVNGIAIAVVASCGTFGFFMIRRILKDQEADRKDVEILRGEHLRVKKKIKELDIEIPPGTRVPDKGERK